MRVWVFAFVMTSGCSSCGKSDPPPVPVAPAPPKAAAAICDVRLESPPAHVCTEIYGADLLPESEHWCNEMKTAKDTAIFQKDANCPAEKQISACRLPSGSVELDYAPTTVGRAQTACGNQHGQFVADTALPEAGAAKAYSCMLTSSKLPPIDGTCLEEESVVDLSKTASKQNCITIYGVFEIAPCPSENAIGRCITRAHSIRSTRVFYGTKHDAGAAHAVCDQIAGEFRE